MLIPTSLVSDKYQTVVPLDVRKQLGVQKGDKLIWQVEETKYGKRAVVKPKPKNWAKYILGLGKDIWKGEDAQEYVNKLRDEWEERERELWKDS